MSPSARRVMQFYVEMILFLGTHANIWRMCAVGERVHNMFEWRRNCTEFANKYEKLFALNE